MLDELLDTRGVLLRCKVISPQCELHLLQDKAEHQAAAGHLVPMPLFAWLAVTAAFLVQKAASRGPGSSRPPALQQMMLASPPWSGAAARL